MKTVYWQLSTGALLLALVFGGSIWVWNGSTEPTPAVYSESAGVISVADLQRAVGPGEYFGLRVVDRWQWSDLLLVASHNGFGVGDEALQNQALSIWGEDTQTRANLSGLFERSR